MVALVQSDKGGDGEVRGSHKYQLKGFERHFSFNCFRIFRLYI